MSSPDDFSNMFNVPFVRGMLSQRFGLVDEPICIDKVILSVRFGKLNVRNAWKWVKDKPWVMLEETDYNYRFILRAPLLHKMMVVAPALRGIVREMYESGLFYVLHFEVPRGELIKPTDFLFQFVTISEVEIAFNFREYQIPSSLFLSPKTQYSSGYLPGGDGSPYRHSPLYAYNRILRLKHQNQHRHSAIDALQYPYRVEFQLNSHFCHFINLANLEGTANQIALRYLGLLTNIAAVFWPDDLRVKNLDGDGSQILHSLIFEYFFPVHRHGLKPTAEWNRELESLLQRRRQGQI